MRSLTTQAALHSLQISLSLPLFSHPFSAASRAGKADAEKDGRVKVDRRALRASAEKGRNVDGEPAVGVGLWEVGALSALSRRNGII